MNLALFVAYAQVARAECDAASLQQAIDRAEHAFVEMDLGGFQGAAADARRNLACVQDALSPIQVAGFHRLCALEAYLNSDHAGSTLYFRAVTSTQPGYVLPLEIAPEGHPLRDDFERSKEYGPDTRFDLDPPATGWLTVDGQRATSAPGGHPFVLQWFDDAGAVALTSWVAVGAPLPNYPVKPPAPDPVPVPIVEPKRSGVAFTVTGLTAAAVGAGLYGTAFVFRGQYLDAVAAGDEQKIIGTHTTTNVLTIVGSSLVGGGALFTLAGVF